MGFDQRKVTRALAMCGDNVATAMDLLMSDVDLDEAEQAQLQNLPF